MRNKSTGRFLAIVLAFAMILTGTAASVAVNGQSASAAKKKAKVTLKLNVKSSKKSPYKLKKGKTKTLKIVKKNVKKIKSLKWSSSKKSVATVSKKGKVTAKKAGTATISAKFKYIAKGSKKAKSKTLKAVIKVTAPATNTEPNNTPGPAMTTPSASPSTDLSVSDMSDPTVGVADAATVTDAEVTADTSNVGEEHDSSGGVATVDNGMMRKKLTAHQLIEFMGQGWNLANTMEACGATANTVAEYETSWGQVRTTQSIIDGIKASGFKSIRIPVAWSNMMSTDGKYTINESFMRRVEQIVNFALKDELYVVLNIHYDSGWWGMFGSEDAKIQAEAWKKYTAIWQQIATRFKEYSDRLVFESANEELGGPINTDNLGLNTAVNGVTGKRDMDWLYGAVNKINQKFVSIVRATGGNNAYRQLLIAGYSTNIDKTCSDKYVMPTDTVKANGKTKLSVSVHFYDPSSYCITENTADSSYAESWGSDYNKSEMHKSLDKMAKFTDQGYGVIIGEYGPQAMAKKGVIDYCREIMTYAPPRHMAPIIWNLSLFDRTDLGINYSDFADLLKEVTGAENIPMVDGPDITGVPSVEIVDESTLTKVAEWSGKWTRCNGASSQTDANGNVIRDEKEVGGFEQGTASEGVTVTSNLYWWQMFVNYDWSKLTKPCIKITVGDDSLSQQAGFQLGYGKIVEEGKDPTFSTVEQFDTSYVGKTVTLKPNKLAVRPWVCLTNQTPGASIVKVEIFDETKAE